MRQRRQGVLRSRSSKACKIWSVRGRRGATSGSAVVAKIAGRGERAPAGQNKGGATVPRRRRAPGWRSVRIGESKRAAEWGDGERRCGKAGLGYVKRAWDRRRGGTDDEASCWEASLKGEAARQGAARLGYRVRRRENVRSRRRRGGGVSEMAPTTCGETWVGGRGRGTARRAARGDGATCGRPPWKGKIWKGGDPVSISHFSDFFEEGDRFVISDFFPLTHPPSSKL